MKAVLWVKCKLSPKKTCQRLKSGRSNIPIHTHFNRVFHRKVITIRIGINLTQVVVLQQIHIPMMQTATLKDQSIMKLSRIRLYNNRCPYYHPAAAFSASIPTEETAWKRKCRESNSKLFIHLRIINKTWMVINNKYRVIMMCRRMRIQLYIKKYVIRVQSLYLSLDRIKEEAVLSNNKYNFHCCLSFLKQTINELSSDIKTFCHIPKAYQCIYPFQHIFLFPSYSKYYLL